MPGLEVPDPAQQDAQLQAVPLSVNPLGVALLPVWVAWNPMVVDVLDVGVWAGHWPVLLGGDRDTHRRTVSAEGEIHVDDGESFGLNPSHRN